MIKCKIYIPERWKTAIKYVKIIQKVWDWKVLEKAGTSSEQNGRALRKYREDTAERLWNYAKTEM